MAKKSDATTTAKTVDAGTTETPAKGAAPEKPAAPPKPKMENKNGVTRPRPGTQTGRIWDVCDDLSNKSKKPAERGQVMEICLAEGLNKATIATQYGRWCKFNGIIKQTKKPAAPAAPAASEK